MVYECDAGKAAGNLRKHGVAFTEAATVFLDPLTVTYQDPDHSEGSAGTSPLANRIGVGLSLFRILTAVIGFGSSAPGRRREKRYMRTAKHAKKRSDDLRPEYDFSALGPRVRGKYFRRATAGTNLVLIDPELAKAFPTGKAVNNALRMLVDIASAAPARKRRAHRRAV